MRTESKTNTSADVNTSCCTHLWVATYSNLWLLDFMAMTTKPRVQIFVRDCPLIYFIFTHGMVNIVGQICFIFTSDWLREWCTFSGLITEQSKEDTKQSHITFNTQLKLLWFINELLINWNNKYWRSSFTWVVQWINIFIVWEYSIIQWCKYCFDVTGFSYNAFISFSFLIQ